MNLLRFSLFSVPNYFSSHLCWWGSFSHLIEAASDLLLCQTKRWKKNWTKSVESERKRELTLGNGEWPRWGIDHKAPRSDALPSLLFWSLEETHFSQGLTLLNSEEGCFSARRPLLNWMLSFSLSTTMLVMATHSKNFLAWIPEMLEMSP